MKVQCVKSIKLYLGSTKNHWSSFLIGALNEYLLTILIANINKMSSTRPRCPAELADLSRFDGRSNYGTQNTQQGIATSSR